VKEYVKKWFAAGKVDPFVKTVDPLVLR
jgi:hypothetical protein